MQIARRLTPLLVLAAVLAGPAAAHAALTAEMDFASKTVTIAGDGAADALAISDNGTHLVHNISTAALESPTDFDTEGGVQQVDADESWQVVVDAGGGDDTVSFDTSEVLRVLGDLGPGDDAYQGSTRTPGVPDAVTGGAGDDRLAGGRNPASSPADEMRGGDGNDLLVWNNGDGNDELDGEGGADTVEVNGSPVSGDEFNLKPEGGALRLDRINLGLFFLLIATTTERVRVNGLGGGDTTNAEPGVGALGVALELNGGTGEDILDGSDGGDAINGGDDADKLNGGAGQDRLAGDRGDDAMAGGDGDDTLVWNNGDNTDVADGDAGFDTLEVNGAAAGDAFTIKASGVRTAFARTNLVPFGIDASTEVLDLDTLGGDDSAVASGAPPILLDVDGGSGADTLTGDAGNDALRGGSGADTLTGGGGTDVIDGDDGDDAVSAQDGVADLVRCGAGNDTATLDGSAFDAAADCETAVRPAVAPPAPAAQAVKILTGKVKVKKGRAAIKLQCPAGAPTCRGRLSLGTLRAVRLGRARVVVALGSARYTVAPGQTLTVRVKLPKSLRAIAGRAKSLRTRAAAATEAGGGATLTSTRTVTLTRSRRW